MSLFFILAFIAMCALAATMAYLYFKKKDQPKENEEEIPEGDRLEIQGQVVRIWTLVIGVLVTSVLTLLVFSIVKQITGDPLFYVSAAVITFAAVGIYGRDGIEPGYVGMFNWWGYLIPLYVGHGASWVPKIFGVKLDPVKVRIIIRRFSSITMLDKNNAQVIFRRVRAKCQIIRPKPFRLNTTEEDLNDEVDSKTQEALREEASGATYEELKAMTSEDQKRIKTRIEEKLKEEQDLGTHMVAIEWAEVVSSEIVMTEDQEVIARKKRMDQFLEQTDELGKKLDGLTAKEKAEIVKVVAKITPEKMETVRRENTVDVGEKLGELIGKLTDPLEKLLAKFVIEKFTNKESGTKKICKEGE